jgi:carboxypeptidase Q
VLTHIRRTVAVLVVLAAIALLPPGAPWAAGEKIDLDAIYRIKQEGLQRSKIMETASYLTDVYGSRLTGSPNARDAAEWTLRWMKEWGVSNVHLETWPFGRGWGNQRFVAMAVTPRPFPLIGFPKAWTPGTNGPVTSEAVMAVIEAESDFEKYHGQLRGKFVLTTPMRDVAARFEPLGHRFTDTELAEIATEPNRGGRRNFGGNQAQAAFERKKMQFWLEEGVAAVIDPSRGDGGTFFVQSGGSQNPSAPAVPPQVVLAIEHYGRIARVLEKNIPVTLQLDIANTFYDADPTSFNIVGELPGTDKADEVVMIGAHFDSWHAGTGATDNAAGSAVMLEAMRILKTTGVKMRRTVRIGLWTGEEEGLLGSRAYVKAHFGDPATMKLTAEHAKLSGYFNLDNGTGTIRGVYLQGNEAVAPIFSSWIEPFRNMGMTTASIRNTGGTDHLSFDAVGLPGFQFIQDPIEYDARTHHSNMDTYERLQANDMMRNAVIVATFVYNTANRDEKLPRKPLPPPPLAPTSSQ